MSTHTPGPWYWSEEGSLVQTSHITRDVWFIPMNEADQALIAAAPELLEALGLMLDHVDYRSGACGLTETVGGALPRVALDRARAALAKATGGTP